MTEPISQPELVDTPIRTVVKTSRDAPPLSSEYHKARRQLMLWASILLIWSLVGVDLDKAKGAEGGVGAVVKSIKSPQAVPWVLVVLVTYFAFKLSVEWLQCNVARRSLSAARVDFVSSMVVCALANLLYFGQLVFRIQFADVLQGSNRWQSAFVGAITGIVLGYGLGFSHLFSRHGHVVQHQIGCGLTMFGAVIAVGSIIIAVLVNRALNWKYFVIACVSVAVPMIVSFVIHTRRFERNRHNRHAPMEAEKTPTEQ